MPLFQNQKKRAVDVRLLLYEKHTPRRGKKLGHI